MLYQILKLILISIGILSSTTVYAQHSYHNAVHQKSLYITDIEPLHNSANGQHCLTSNTQASQAETEKYAATVAGAVIGGLVGNQFGDGKGKTLMTIAGTILGGVTAYHYNQNDHNSVQDSQRCQPQKPAKHYLVSYHYQGQQYQTVLNYRPEKSIPIALHHQINKGYF